MRGRPSGFGHDPVVQMCPQKWNASLLSGRTAAATAAPPVAARTAPPMRPRNDLLVIPEARRSASARAAPSKSPSVRRMFHPCGAKRDETVELLERVDRALGRDEPVDELSEERDPRNAPAFEHGGLFVLVHGSHRHSLAFEGPNSRRDRAAKAAVGAEKRDELVSGSVEEVALRGAVSEGRALFAELERDARPDAHREHTHLAVESEHERSQRENGET